MLHTAAQIRFGRLDQRVNMIWHPTKSTIRRQKPQAFREIVQLAADKQTDKAFAKLLELGAVTEVLADGHQTDTGQLYRKAADAYLSATKQGKSVLLVSPTWSEIEQGK